MKLLSLLHDAMKHIFGKNIKFKARSKFAGEDQDPMIVGETDSDKLIKERKQSFYRWLLKNDYVTILNINSDSGARAKNMLYTSIVNNAIRRATDRHYTTEDQLEQAAQYFYEIPQSYREEMYRQGFLDMMVILRSFSRDLVAKNTVDNSIWILTMEDPKPLFDVELEKVDKDGYTYHVPKRRKYKAKSDVVTLENADKFISPLLMDIYDVLKGFKISINTFDIQDGLSKRRDIV